MSNSQFIGRGEVIAKKILLKSIDCIGIEGQVNIRKIILPEDYEFIDQEIKNHNFDWVIRRTNKPDIVVEINYKHKEKAAYKWRNIFIPMITNAGYYHLAINDWDCRPRGLFWLNTKKKHLAVTWDDFRDVQDALETHGINPDIVLE